MRTSPDLSDGGGRLAAYRARTQFNLFFERTYETTIVDLTTSVYAFYSRTNHKMIKKLVTMMIISTEAVQLDKCKCPEWRRNRIVRYRN